jgi:hypothetical protein
MRKIAFSDTEASFGSRNFFGKEALRWPHHFVC